MNKPLEMKEVKDTVMGLNRDSVGGADGMIGAFHQDAW